jgi:nucleotide-binding universal stress UspA family protein
MDLIVVGTDGSETATSAVRRASELAKQTGGKLALVSAYKPLSSARIRGAEAAGADAAAWASSLSESRVDAILRDATSLVEADGVEVETYSRTGDPADAILNVAEERHADLIVVGNKGMTGAKRYLLGSVPDKITHHAPCSVMVVRTS